jgi:coenzyme F420 hydrogenase subunit beta
MCWPTSRWATWAAQGQQWLLVRNQRGQELLDLLGDEVALSKPGQQAGKRQGP